MSISLKFSFGLKRIEKPLTYFTHLRGLTLVYEPLLSYYAVLSRKGRNFWNKKHQTLLEVMSLRDNF